MADGLQPVNFGNAGDVDMYPAETYAAAKAISEAGRLIRDAWREAAPALEEDEQKIGTGFDDLSAGFRKRYTELKPQLEKVATEAAANFETMGSNGINGVKLYLQLTHQQVALLQSLNTR